MDKVAGQTTYWLLSGGGVFGSPPCFSALKAADCPPVFAQLIRTMKKLLIIIGVTIGLNTALADWPKKLWEKTETEHNLGPIKSFQIQAVGKDKSVQAKICHKEY